ncbi:helix-turn-helix domain-containing protein [Pannonibacter sp.]|uniref:helix-turn-helix domain-containing protein n=1 Tax=Pannonibacter sp. TaxID=1906786 RepID=UPI003F6FCF55
MQILDIADVARISGIPASTLRYYEEQGLITSIGRRGLRRLFGPETLQQLGIIALSKSAGFSLNEIRGMFGPDGQPSLSHAQWQARAEELDAHIRQLLNLRDLIQHVAECPAPRHMDCVQFQHLITAAVAARRQEDPTTPPARTGSGHSLRPPRSRR